MLVTHYPPTKYQDATSGSHSRAAAAAAAAASCYPDKFNLYYYHHFLETRVPVCLTTYS